MGSSARGELLTLTTAEATDWGYNDGVAANRAEVLAAAGLADAPVIETEPSLAERFVRFITDPVVSSLLITAGVLILIADLFVEGFGIGGVVGLALLALFFWGHFLAGLTGWEDLALVVLGLVLIAIEIIVVPGFGIPGVLGLAALLGGLFLAMLGREIQTPEGIAQAGLTILASFIGIVIGIDRHRRLSLSRPALGGSSSIPRSAAPRCPGSARRRLAGLVRILLEPPARIATTRARRRSCRARCPTGLREGYRCGADRSAAQRHRQHRWRTSRCGDRGRAHPGGRTDRGRQRRGLPPSGETGRDLTAKRPRYER